MQVSLPNGDGFPLWDKSLTRDAEPGMFWPPDEDLANASVFGSTAAADSLPHSVNIIWAISTEYFALETSTSSNG
jgi:hypothetical protein